MKKVGKNLILFFAIGAMMVSIYAGLSTAGTLDTKQVITSVKVGSFTGLTLYEADGITSILTGATRDFSKNYNGDHTPRPNETSWQDIDDWTVEGPQNPDLTWPNAPSRITAQCVYNTNPTIWYLKIKVNNELKSDGNTIPFTFTVPTGTYAYYGWTASAETIEKGTVNPHKYTHGGMMPYSITDELAYTSGTEETGAKIYIWTGIQIPFDQAIAEDTPYTSTVTFTLAN